MKLIFFSLYLQVLGIEDMQVLGKPHYQLFHLWPLEKPFILLLKYFEKLDMMKAEYKIVSVLSF